MSSISEIEAEKMYPTRYYDNYPTIVESFYATSDDLQEAYIQGREAEPCKAQIMTVAEYLADTSDGWENLTEKERVPFIETAEEILDIARKAVAE